MGQIRAVALRGAACAADYVAGVGVCVDDVVRRAAELLVAASSAQRVASTPR
jgi:hypothetical protein